jgi:hypothetical protein
MNMVEILILVHENGKIRPVETVPGMGVERIRENDGELNSTVIF